MVEHGAAKSGVKSEKRTKEIISECGLILLKVKEDFIKYYGDKEAALYTWKVCQHITIPEDQRNLPNAVNESGEYAYYTPDGYIPELDLRIEIKYSGKKGTTESKVFDDLEKMRDGIYSDKRLLYLFIGPLAKKTFKFDRFAKKVKEFDPTEQKVKVLFDDTPDLVTLKSYLTSEYQSKLELERQNEEG